MSCFASSRRSLILQALTPGQWAGQQLRVRPYKCFNLSIASLSAQFSQLIQSAGYSAYDGLSDQVKEQLKAVASGVMGGRQLAASYVLLMMTVAEFPSLVIMSTKDKVPERMSFFNKN